MTRKRIILIAVAMMCIAPLVLAQTCPEQTFLDIENQPVALDPNQIAIDPATGQQCLLEVVFCDLGKTWEYKGYICDPEGHSVEVSVDRGSLVVDDDGVFTLSGSPTTVGVTYHTLTVVDTPMPHQEAKVGKGTVAAVATSPNQAPRICGGRP